MKKFLLSLSVFLTLMTAPALASNNTNNDLFQACDKDTTASSVCQEKSGDTKNPINRYIHVAANIVAALTGIAAIIFIIISGLKFVSGGGSPESIKSARSTLIAAVIGLAIVALAWTIITFAVNTLIKN